MGLKIVATVRTLNEERNIERFILAHRSFADKILVADGGSTDKTCLVAESLGAEVRPFGEIVQCAAGGRRNPYGRHVNFLIDWAWEEGADWVIHDDCDEVPTLSLQLAAREVFERTQLNHVNMNRLYVYGKHHYYPRLNMPGQSVWAWNRKSGVRADEANPMVHTMLGVADPTGVHVPAFPCALIHYGWPNDAEIERKIKFYHSTGEGVLSNHPHEWAGPMEHLPEWAVWQ